MDIVIVETDSGGRYYYYMSSEDTRDYIKDVWRKESGVEEELDYYLALCSCRCGFVEELPNV